MMSVHGLPNPEQLEQGAALHAARLLDERIQKNGKASQAAPVIIG
jgi:hypothetical protein